MVWSFLERMWRVRCSAAENERRMEELQFVLKTLNYFNINSPF